MNESSAGNMFVFCNFGVVLGAEEFSCSTTIVGMNTTHVTHEQGTSLFRLNVPSLYNYGYLYFTNMFQ